DRPGYAQEPQGGERPGQNDRPAGARAQAQTARWLRAGGERDRTLAVGADRGPLRILSVPGRSPSRTSQVFARGRDVARGTSSRRPESPPPKLPSATAPPARNLRNTSGL